MIYYDVKTKVLVSKEPVRKTLEDLQNFLVDVYGEKKGIVTNSKGDVVIDADLAALNLVKKNELHALIEDM